MTLRVDRTLASPLRSGLSLSREIDILRGRIVSDSFPEEEEEDERFLPPLDFRGCRKVGETNTGCGSPSFEPEFIDRSPPLLLSKWSSDSVINGTLEEVYGSSSGERFVVEGYATVGDLSKVLVVEVSSMEFTKHVSDDVIFMRFTA